MMCALPLNTLHTRRPPTPHSGRLGSRGGRGVGRGGRVPIVTAIFLVLSRLLKLLETHQIDHRARIELAV
jgi:hypothetical protein